MIEIYPEIGQSESQCPRCGVLGLSNGTLYFQGTHCLTSHICSDCSLEFYATLPIGHAILFPVTFSRDGKHQKFNQKEGSWMAEPLINSIQNPPIKEVPIQLIQTSSGGDLLLVNCLDSCFGHVFTKIYNVYLLKKHFPKKTLGVLLPERCRWLISDKEVEIWSVDLPLENIGEGVQGLDSWVKQQFKRFHSVALSVVPVHIDQEQLDFKEILGVKPFELEEFDRLPLQLTFIWRSDRFWLNSKGLDLLHKASIKYNFQNWVEDILQHRQGSLLRRLVNRVRKSFPNVAFYVTGIGRNGKFPHGCHDERVEKMQESIERKWNEVYRRSHLVLGVHGSHMLIPTALSAGFIEILPRHKIDHLTEDIAQSHNSRLSHFLGRYMDEYATPELISKHVVSMVKKFDFIKSNMDSELA
ncbi:hypothetical protein Q4534_17165 [Cyclobacterium sp. 1_MG-2023]|uniref:hypothetical protein n=1 Tax=Cyclobacterium sp. 1_MG-2023 TaxID=3062681 RepID=UPI0026E33EEE|nr:hypothetical protein [Cyclobacterium sp. 1_MG-2023]MDO6439155.1 hypothetical protein [Cyclobacterium sp. 1_MG-2023]